MSSTLRLGDDKKKLEKLRALATRASGRKVTQERLLGGLLDCALARGQSFLAEAFGEGKPVSEREFERILGLASDWGVETGPEESDQVLYGTGIVRRKKMREAAVAMDKLRESTKTPGWSGAGEIRKWRDTRRRP